MIIKNLIKNLQLKSATTERFSKEGLPEHSGKGSFLYTVYIAFITSRFTSVHAAVGLWRKTGARVDAARRRAQRLKRSDAAASV